MQVSAIVRSIFSFSEDLLYVVLPYLLWDPSEVLLCHLRWD